jgi:hypothetical protein
MNATLQNFLNFSFFQSIFGLFEKNKSDTKKYQNNSINQYDAKVTFKLDMTLIWVIFVLLIFGMVMVYSASIAMPDNPRFANLTGTYYLFSLHCERCCFSGAFGFVGKGCTLVVCGFTFIAHRGFDSTCGPRCEWRSSLDTVGLHQLSTIRIREIRHAALCG